MNVDWMKLDKKKEWRLWLVALSFFTRLPVRIADFEETDLNHSAKYFPLVGVLVGAIAAAVYGLAIMVWPLEIAVLASMLATIWLTGAFHEDGLADAADGLGSGWEKEQVLTIMQDSRLGSFGAIALFLVLLVKFQALSHLPGPLLPGIMLAGHSLSRFAALLVIYTQSYVKSSGKAKPLATQLSQRELWLAALFGLFPLLVLAPKFLFALLPVVIVWYWFSHKLKKRLGGYTGDCLGAMQQLCELAFYLGALAWGWGQELLMEIYLVRHTSPDIASGICYGQSDIDVAGSFSEELVLIKHKLATIKPAICFSSPSLRCTKLAEALDFGTVIKDKRLMELDFGDWELRRWDDIPRDELDAWAHDHVNQAPSSGETFNQLHQRATEFLMQVNANSVEAPMVVITHGGVIRALLTEVLGLPLMEAFDFQIDYSSVTQLLIDEKVMRVGYVNR